MNLQPLKCFFGSHPKDEESYVVDQEMMDFDGRPEVRAEKKYCICGTCWIRFRAINYYLHANRYGLDSPPKFSKWIRYG